MRVIGLAGWSGAGKTTLLVRLIPALNPRGLAVSTLKHAHHAFDIDQPGKDSLSTGPPARARSWSPRPTLGAVHEARGEGEPSLAMLLRRLSPVDLVVVEGYKACAHVKIEVLRAANGKPLLFGQAPNIRAIATDVPLPDVAVPVIDLDDVEAITECDLASRQPIDQALVELDGTPSLNDCRRAACAGRLEAESESRGGGASWPNFPTIASRSAAR